MSPEPPGSRGNTVYIIAREEAFRKGLKALREAGFDRTSVAAKIGSIRGTPTQARLAHREANSPVAARPVRDFPPTPSELVYKEDTVKVTRIFHRRSVDFFKQEAKGCDTQYRKMMKRMLDLYEERQTGAEEQQQNRTL